MNTTLPIANVWTFVGPFAVVTTAPGQRITASGSAALAVTAGTSSFSITLCIQNNSTPGVLSDLSLSNYLDVTVGTTRGLLTLSTSGLPGAGTWRVGLCYDANSAAINANDWSTGWVTVTN